MKVGPNAQRELSPGISILNPTRSGLYTQCPFTPALVETEVLSQDEHLAGLNKINREMNCEGRSRGLAQTTGRMTGMKNHARSARRKGHWVYNPHRVGFKMEIPGDSVPLRIWPNFI